MIELEEELDYSVRIKVVGVGGAGCTVIDKMLDWEENIDLLAINTDARALKKLRLPRKFRIGAQLTKALGAGGNPDIGRKAIYKERERIMGMIAEAELVFIIAGLGGGTGTGASPFVAELASEIGAVTVAVVTKPFTFEGIKKVNQAEMGVRELRKTVDTLISIPNEKLFANLKTDSFLLDAFDKADRMLLEAVKTICDFIGLPGLIDLDFADVRQVLKKSGEAVFGVGIAEGGERGKCAAESALNSPLLQNIDISKGKNVLVSIVGGEDLKQEEVDKAVQVISRRAEQNMVLGVAVDRQLKKKVKVTLIVTGLTSITQEKPLQILEKPVSNFGSGQRVYLGHFEDEMDIPTFLRKRKKR